MHEFWTIPTATIMISRSQIPCKFGGWQTWNTNINSCGCCVLYVVIVVRCFCPSKCTSFILFGHVICLNLLKAN